MNLKLRDKIQSQADVPSSNTLKFYTHEYKMSVTEEAMIKKKKGHPKVGL